MFAAIRKIPNLEQKFSDLSNVNRKATAFRLTGIDRAPGSGQSADPFAHHQGICYVNNIHFYRNGSGPRFKYAACIYGNENGAFEVYSIEMHVISRESRCNGWNI